MSVNTQPCHCVTTHYGTEGLNTPPIWHSFPSRYADAYKNEMEHFLDIVQGKAEPIVKYHESLAVSKIATACEESARSGKMVELTWAPHELAQ